MTERAVMQVRFCEVFRMPAQDGGAAETGAGVRKPSREETDMPGPDGEVRYPGGQTGAIDPDVWSGRA